MPEEDNIDKNTRLELGDEVLVIGSIDRIG